MIQSRTHNCNELRIGNVGERVTLAGWYENLRKVSKNLGFLILRDFYGTTQIVIETEEIMRTLEGINNESTLCIKGIVRERSNKNPNAATGDVEVVPDKITVLGNCRYNALPFEINHSTEADENIRLKYRYLDLRNPQVKDKIVLRSRIVAELRQNDRAGIPGDHHSDSYMLFSGRGSRLPCSFQGSSGKILCIAPGAAAV